MKRLVRQIRGSEPRHFPQVRIRTVKYGGWSFSPARLARDSVVYSLGTGTDVAFDVALIQRFGLAVHAFDPTPAAVEWIATHQLPDRFHFHPIGIAAFDGAAEFTPTRDFCYTMLPPSNAQAHAVTMQVCRLRTVLQRLGHQHIDLLKMDIEGAEYDVIPDIIATGIPVLQLLVEFHHRFRHIGAQRTRDTVDLLRDHGFRIFHISPSGREYSLIHHP